MKKHHLSLIIGLIALFLISDAYSGSSIEVMQAAIGRRMTVQGNNVQLTPGNAPRKLLGYTGTWFPYAAVYRITVTKGSRYTLYFYYPADSSLRKVVILGENPLDDTEVKYPGNLSDHLRFYSAELTTHSNVSPCRETRRFNITVHPHSKSNKLYLICMFHDPSVPLDFMLNSGADPDSIVKVPSLMPGCEKLGKIYWGKILDSPIYLNEAAAPGQTPARRGSANMRFEEKGWGPIPAGDRRFSVPDGMMAVNFRASVHWSSTKTSAQQAWHIERIDSKNDKVVYRYIIGYSLREQREVVAEPLGRLSNLVLPSGTYMLSMSGDSSAYMHLYFDLVPARGGGRRG